MLSARKPHCVFRLDTDRIQALDPKFLSLFNLMTALTLALECHFSFGVALTKIAARRASTHFLKSAGCVPP